MQNIWRETVKGLEAVQSINNGGTHAHYTINQLTEKEVDG